MLLWACFGRFGLASDMSQGLRSEHYFDGQMQLEGRNLHISCPLPGVFSSLPNAQGARWRGEPFVNAFASGNGHRRS
jgi:hypothetical protein